MELQLLLKTDTHIKGHKNGKTKNQPSQLEIQKPGLCLGTESEQGHIEK